MRSWMNSSIVALQDAVQLDARHPFPHLREHLRRDDASDIGDRDRRVGHVPELHRLEAQVGIRDLPPQHGDIPAQHLGEAFPRTAHDRLHVRLLDRARLHLFGADGESGAGPFRHDDRMAVQQHGERFREALHRVDRAFRQHAGAAQLEPLLRAAAGRAVVAAGGEERLQHRGGIGNAVYIPELAGHERSAVQFHLEVPGNQIRAGAESSRTRSAFASRERPRRSASGCSAAVGDVVIASPDFCRSGWKELG